MQEQVNEKMVSLVINGSKLTGRTLARAIEKFLFSQKQKSKGEKPEAYRGKQSLKKLAGQDAGMSNIEIKDGGIRSFEKYARKYGVDFAVKRDKANNKWLVFFKARDADALNSAFKEFNAKVMKQKRKPSLLSAISKAKQRAAVLGKDRVKKKKRDLEL